MNSARLPIILLAVLFSLMVSGSVLAQSGELIGVVSKEEIKANDRIFEIYVNRYEPVSSALDYLSAQSDSVKLVIFLGSWCRESKKYVPGLIKTLELVSSDFISTEYISVDAQKKFPKSFLKKFQIKYIPTVVVLKGNEEIGRIEEKPHELIETDLVQILKKAELKKAGD